MILSWFIFWITYFFEKNELKKEHRISRLDLFIILVTNIGLGISLSFLFVTHYFIILFLLIFIFQVRVWFRFIRRVDSFVKTKHGDNYCTERWDTWWADKKNREEYLEELYVFEKSSFEYWKNSGGEAREREAEQEENKERERGSKFRNANSGYRNNTFNQKEEPNENINPVTAALRRF